MTYTPPVTESDALTEARYYGRNFAPKANLDPEECEQEAMISAWKWLQRAQDRCTLWDHVRLDLVDYARRVNGRTRKTAELPKEHAMWERKLTEAREDRHKVEWALGLLEVTRP